MKYDCFTVNGCRVLLLGTQHSRISEVTQNPDEFDPTEQPEYQVLSDFQPSKILFEIPSTSRIKTYAKRKTDCAAIYEYAESNSVEMIKYDKRTEKSYLEYVLTSPDGFDEKIEGLLDDRDEYRRTLRKEYPEMFEDVYSSREDHASSVFISELDAGSKVAIHCGRLHYTTYKRLFEFLS